MLDLPYQAYKEVLPTNTYTVMLTYLPLAEYRYLPQFIYFVFLIVGQLRKSEGLVGYTLRAGVFHKQFWTLSIWENEHSLRDFVQHAPHTTVRARLQGKMGKTAFYHWQ